ncbi:MAG: murein biosynthesis integral membrane protein MurJ [Alphaproteobacteria bacterium]|nr:murein biosynthesis integral membrane protein MurJ [Alphaproteobacteria bacterium]
MAAPVATVGGLTLASRALGLVRDLLIAATLGAGPLADAFFLALRLPNLFRALFAEGAFSAAFVPVFAARLEREGPDAARAFGAAVASVLLVVLVPFTLLAEWLMPTVVAVLAPGFPETGERFQAALSLARVTFPYLALITMTAFFAAVLNAVFRFAAAAAAPLLLNLALIGALLFAAGWFETPAHALAWGVLVGGVAQLALVALDCWRAGMPILPGRPRLTPDLRKFGRLMVPGVIGSGVTQFNVMIGTMFASVVPGAVSWLNYAHHLVHLPIAVVGIAVRTALLPALARRLHGSGAAKGQREQQQASAIALGLSVPAAAGLWAVAELAIEVLFERGSFTPADTAATAAALKAYAWGVPAMVLTQALVASFFARFDTSTPVKMAAVAMLVNVAFIVLLMPVLEHVGIALAQSVSAWAHAGLLTVLVVRRGYANVSRASVGRGVRVVLAAAPLVALACLADPLRAELGEMVPFAATVTLVLLVVGGVVVFAGLALVLGVVRPRDLAAAVQRARSR